MWLAISLIISATGSVFIAFLTMVRNPHQSVHRWLFALLCAISAWVVTGNLQSIVSDTHIDILLIRLSFVFALLMGYCMLCFGRSLAQVKDTAIMHGTELLILASGLILSATPLVISGAKADSVGQLPTPDRAAMYPYVIAVILYFVGRALLIIYMARTRTRGQKKAQLTTVFAGLLLGSCIGITTNVILPNVTHGTAYNRFSFLTIVVWTTILIYAITQYRFLDIRWAASRAIVYIMALATAVGVYVVAIFLTTTYIATYFDAITQQIAYISAALFAAITFEPLRHFFDRQTHNIFYRNEYDMQSTLNKLGKLLANTVDIQKISDGAAELLARAIRPESLQLVVLQDAKTVHVAREGQVNTLVTDLLPVFLKQRSNLILSDSYAQSPSKLQQLLMQHGIAAAVRIGTSKDTIGYIVVGYKRSGRIFRRQDINLLRIASDQLAVALQNGLRFREIQLFNQTLQTKVIEATHELQQKNTRLRALDKAKDEFISTASHQMRTPLTSIKGYLSMALEGHGGPLKPTQKALLEEAYNSTQRMVFLVADFLSLSRIRTDKFVLTYRPTQLDQIVVQEVRRLQGAAEARNVALTFESPAHFPTLQLDDEKIRQVVMNLIDNAIYYTRAGGKVTVQLSSNDKEIRFTVEDTGVGVPLADQPRLFTKFFRASNALKMRPDGTGIGLFLVRKIVTLHGGTMIFHSQEKKGSTFGFRFTQAALIHDGVGKPAKQGGKTNGRKAKK